VPTTDLGADADDGRHGRRPDRSRTAGAEPTAELGAIRAERAVSPVCPPREALAYRGGA
jgi:hypothetical protein